MAGAGILGLAASRVWQVIDAVVVPPNHNRRLRAVQEKPNQNLRYLPTPPGWRSYVVPAAEGRGAIAGAHLSF